MINNGKCMMCYMSVQFWFNVGKYFTVTHLSFHHLSQVSQTQPEVPNQLLSLPPIGGLKFWDSLFCLSLEMYLDKFTKFAEMWQWSIAG